MTLCLVGIPFVFRPFSLQGLGGAGSRSQVLLSLKCEAEGVLKAKTTLYNVLSHPSPVTWPCNELGSDQQVICQAVLQTAKWL